MSVFYRSEISKESKVDVVQVGDIPAMEISYELASWDDPKKRVRWWSVEWIDPLDRKRHGYKKHVPLSGGDTAAAELFMLKMCYLDAHERRGYDVSALRSELVADEEGQGSGSSQ